MDVAVVGGGDSALDEGLFVTRYASKVTVIHRRDTLRASAFLQERAFANPKMDFIWDTVVESIDGAEAVESLHLRNVKTGEESDLPVAAVFIFIGHTPNSSFLEGLVEMDAGGHVIVNEWMETNVARHLRRRRHPRQLGAPGRQRPPATAPRRPSAPTTTSRTTSALVARQEASEARIAWPCSFEAALTLLLNEALSS